MKDTKFIEKMFFHAAAVPGLIFIACLVNVAFSIFMFALGNHEKIRSEDFKYTAIISICGVPYFLFIYGLKRFLVVHSRNRRNQIRH